MGGVQAYAGIVLAAYIVCQQIYLFIYLKTKRRKVWEKTLSMHQCKLLDSWVKLTVQGQLNSVVTAGPNTHRHTT